MNGTIYQRIEDNAHFRELVEKRQRFATILSIIMLAVYIGFILLIAFAPGWLGTPLNPNTSVTRGIPIGVGVRYKHHEKSSDGACRHTPFRS